MTNVINLARIRAESKDDDITILASHIIENKEDIKELKEMLLYIQNHIIKMEKT